MRTPPSPACISSCPSTTVERSKTAVARLQAEFANSVDAESVQRLIYCSYDKLNANATIRDFLPLLAERFARQRLQALTKINDKSSEHNWSCCSCAATTRADRKMAMDLFNHLAGGGAVVWSGGSQPVGEINPAAVAVMAERGIDISGGYPQAVDW